MIHIEKRENGERGKFVEREFNRRELETKFKILSVFYYFPLRRFPIFVHTDVELSFRSLDPLRKEAFNWKRQLKVHVVSLSKSRGVSQG